MATLSHRSTRALFAAAVASLVAAFAATSASAAPGDVYFGGSGKCWPTTTGKLYMEAPSLTVYGLRLTDGTSTDQVHIWHRLVDDYGSSQTDWIDHGSAPATTTRSATVASGSYSLRGQLNQWSRFQFFIAWYKSGRVVDTQTRILASYAVYGLDVYNSTLSWQGYKTACYG
jgi:hypothetical protein